MLLRRFCEIRWRFPTTRKLLPGCTLILTFSLREKELALTCANAFTSSAVDLNFLSLRERAGVRVSRKDVAIV